MRFALFQMEIGSEFENNLDRIRSAAKEASVQMADALILPEYWAAGFDLDSMLRSAAPLDRGIFETLKGIAVEYRIAVFGTGPRSVGNKVRNTLVCFDRDGSLLGHYDKVHLFTQTGEDRVLESGDRSVSIKTKWGVLGFLICHDLRYPESARALALAGAEALIVPAYWPESRVEDWRLLLRARAVENQIFVLGCNAAGCGKTRMGFSSVVGPSGRVVHESGREPALEIVDLDLEEVSKSRENIFYLKNRKPGTYDIQRGFD